MTCLSNTRPYFVTRIAPGVFAVRSFQYSGTENLLSPSFIFLQECHPLKSCKISFGHVYKLPSPKNASSLSASSLWGHRLTRLSNTTPYCFIHRTSWLVDGLRYDGRMSNGVFTVLNQLDGRWVG